MSDLSKTSMLIAIAALVSSVFCIYFPEKVRSAVAAFPRNRKCAVILTVIVIIWASWLLYLTPLGRFENQKNGIFILAPLAIYLILKYVDELLAARALGALLLLIPEPILRTVRFSDSKWSWVVGVLAYCMVLAGMWFVLSPYRLRHLAGLLFKDNFRCKTAGFMVGAIGVMLIFLSLTAY